jgi:N-acyl-D-aspartate/D-glutamate deacylase
MDGSAQTWDVLLKNAQVFDGTGTPPVVQDVAVKDGRIAAMAPNLSAVQAAQTLDLHGQWLMPGLLDVHTHFDLEVELEPQLPEAVRHGTTTVIAANCSLGVTYGHQRRNGEDPIVDCFARVENVPKTVLAKVADQCTWTTSAEYLDHFDDLALGPNFVTMIPHSMLRIEVMGLKESVTREPTADELRQMQALLEQGMAEGYVGFSTDALPFHFLANRPHTDKQIPTQFAPFKELKALTDVVRRWDRVWQATPPKDDKLAVFRNFLLTSGRLYGKPLKVTAVAAIDVATNASIARLGLLLSRILNSRLVNGFFRLQALAAPFKTWSDGVITPIAEEIPELRRLNECDLDDRAARMAILHDPAWVADFRRMWFKGKRGFNLANLLRLLKRENLVLSRRLDDMTIAACPLADWNGELMDTVWQRLRTWQRTNRGACSAAEAEAFAAFPRPCDDADFFLHLMRCFDTDLRWSTVTANRDPKVVRDLLFHPLLLPGFNDSGAHLTNMAFYDGNLRMLQIAQREGIGQVAHAVHRLTQEPAELFGLDAGVLRVGARADIAVIHPEVLASYDAEAGVRYVYREAFDHHQLVNRSDGVVSAVLIGGKLAWHDGAYAPNFGKEAFGRLLRHRDHARSAQARLAA